MKKRKQFLVMLLMAAIVGCMAAGCGSKNSSETGKENKKEESVKFTITTDSANRSEYCQLFVDYVEEKSEGRYTGEVLAANSLGSGGDTAQMIQMGTLDFCLNDDMTIDGILDGKLGFAWLPGLVADYDEADEYYSNGWISEQVAGIMKENDIIRISSFCNGFRQVGNVKREITTMDDLKGLKIRIPSVASVESFYEKCGALPVSIPGSEVLSAIQTGTVDGLDNAVFNYVNQGLTDVITYITELNYCYSGGCFVASPKFWNELSDEDQTMFAECAQKASDEFTEYFRTTTDELIEEGIDNGQWELAQPTEEMQTELQTIYEEIWEESKDKYPTDIMDAIISGEYKDK